MERDQSLGANTMKFLLEVDSRPESIARYAQLSPEQHAHTSDGELFVIDRGEEGMHLAFLRIPALYGLERLSVIKVTHLEA